MFLGILESLQLEIDLTEQKKFNTGEKPMNIRKLSLIKFILGEKALN